MIRFDKAAAIPDDYRADPVGYYRAVRERTLAPPKPTPPTPAEPASTRPHPEPIALKAETAFGAFLPFHAAALVAVRYSNATGVCRRKLTMAELARRIADEVAAHYDVAVEDVKGRARTPPNLLRARHVTMYRIKKEVGWSLPHIGRFMGGRDHTTVLSAIRKIARERGELP